MRDEGWGMREAGQLTKCGMFSSKLIYFLSVFAICCQLEISQVFLSLSKDLSLAIS